MTTVLSEHKLSRSVPWKEALYPRLRDPEHARGYIDACAEESPTVIGGGICDVIAANKDIPFIAYQVICAYSDHLTVDDIPLLVETLQGLDQVYQEYLSDLYWWLNMLKETLVHGLQWLQVNAKPLDVPDELKANEAYQQWAKVA